MAKKSSFIESRRWTVTASAEKEASHEISKSLGLTESMGRLLYLRGCRTPDEAKSFLGFKNGVLHDPFLLPDMEAAAERILKAVRDGERITVYGDYDVDGVTSTASMCLYLEELGADVDYYIPNREDEGYGVNTEALTQIISEGTKLIVTVDTGVTANEEVDFAASNGCDVVVTDHHECPEILPSAVAVVNPLRTDSEYPYRGLAGVGVVYKVLCALESKVRTNGDIERAVMSISYKYADLVTIGTIADIMPMTDENRLIVRYGLGRLEKTERVGVDALITASSSSAFGPGNRPKKITSGYVSFTMAPRINSAGRVADASVAAELFMTSDKAYASKLADKLCEYNRDRQQMETAVALEAYNMIDRDGEEECLPAIILKSDDWNPGIIGIVSSRLTEKYSRPTILISFKGGNGGAEDVGKGSGRCVKGIDMVEALSECSDYLLKYGGHTQAAGLSIERRNFDSFKSAFCDAVKRRTDDIEDPSLPMLVDDVLSSSEITKKFASEIASLEPFGSGNQMPLFATEGLLVKSVVSVGAGKHTKLILATDGYDEGTVAMCFSVKSDEIAVMAGDLVDVAYSLELNEYRVTSTAQMMVRSIKKNGAQLEYESRLKRLSDEIMGQKLDSLDSPDEYIPTRNEFVQVYTVLKHEIAQGRKTLSIRRLRYITGGAMNYVKVKIIVEVFAETGVYVVTDEGDDTYSFADVAHEQRINLDRSVLLSGLKRKYTKAEN
ncbi:MAG: single-stranded-DNA-specific exonuclease RecJ [Firmicutes bacterium]|nr:single-stranded-DNA-specific exonuclease RecJ [Bacillota bacterium]